MILDILHKFNAIIENYDIQKFRMRGNSHEIILHINLIHGTSLHVRDYMFNDGSRKYSFHWQDRFFQCKIRWDNAPHHQNTKTFPFHKHIGPTEEVDTCEVMNLEKVLEYIKLWSADN